MILSKDERTYQFKALTDLWTGSVTLEGKNGQTKKKRLITTGLVGSIRWWFEVLARGLGGYACDPTDTKCEGRNHCVVCELFGCTGWARKFRFEILDEKGNIKTDQIKREKPFSLRFTPLRPICIEEWALLDATLRLIAEYGAIGGKTVFKPTDEEKRKKETHHQDFGLIKFIGTYPPVPKMEATELSNYICAGRWQKVGSKGKETAFAWASLQHFWCVNGKTLSRENANTSTFNHVIGRPEHKQQSGQNDSWIAGRRPDRKNNIEAESKKVFSFKNPARTFGFVKPGLVDFAGMKTRLRKAWSDLQDADFREGPAILDDLLTKEDRS